MQRRVWKPYRQGHLDSLCGIYAIINALRIAVSPQARLKGKDCHKLFDALVQDAYADGGLHCAVTTGIPARKLRKLLDVAVRTILRDYEVAITVERPLLRSARSTRGKPLVALRAALRDEGASCIVYIGGRLDHWTVVSAMGKRHLWLCDSDGIKKLDLTNVEFVDAVSGYASSKYAVATQATLLVKPLT